MIPIGYPMMALQAREAFRPCLRICSQDKPNSPLQEENRRSLTYNLATTGVFFSVHSWPQNTLGKVSLAFLIGLVLPDLDWAVSCEAWSDQEIHESAKLSKLAH